MDLSSLLHLGGDYRNHKMILIDIFLPGFSLLGDNIDPRGVIWDTQETAVTERERERESSICQNTGSDVTAQRRHLDRVLNIYLFIVKTSALFL